VFVVYEFRFILERFWIQGKGFMVQGSGLRIPDGSSVEVLILGSWVFDNGYWVLGIGYWVLGFAY